MTMAWTQMTMAMTTQMTMAWTQMTMAMTTQIVKGSMWGTGHRAQV